MWLMEAFSQLRDILLPFWELRVADKVVSHKIAERQDATSDSSFEYMKNYSAVPPLRLQAFYEDTLKVKGVLERKLQASLFSVAIGVGILTSVLAVFYQGDFIAFPVWLRWATSFVVFLAIAYMFSAGLLAMKTIGDRNTIHVLRANDYTRTPQDLHFQVAKKAELNSLENLIRQNYMCVVYKLIVNAIGAMVIFFVLIGCTALAGERKQGNEKLELSLESIQSDIKLIQQAASKRSADIEKTCEVLCAEVDSTKQSSQRLEQTTLAQVSQISEINRKLEALGKRLDELEKMAAAMRDTPQKIPIAPTPYGGNP